MSQAPSSKSSFLAVRHRGALPRAYRWTKEPPETGAQIIVERPGGGEEVVTVVGGYDGDPAELPHAYAEATSERLDLLQRRQDFEAQAFAFARQRARSRRLPLKFVRCAIGADKKVRLFYASDNSDDLRDLMRDFAREFGTEVELVQLANREAAGALGGLGPCGRATCCSTFLKVFPNPTTKMAKDQGISLTPQKLSGRCGKMKCCLAYEADTYREYLEQLSLRVGHTVRSPKGYAKVIDLNVIKRAVRVVTLSGRDIASFSAEQVERVKGGVPAGDEKGGYYYGPDGKPAPVRQPKRDDGAARKRRASKDQREARPRRGEQSEKKKTPTDGSEGGEGKRRRRRRRRNRGPKKND